MRRHLLSLLITLHPFFLLSQDYNILDFGAVPDGKTLNTAAIQSAVEAAHQNGRGRVVVPGGVFLTGSIVLKSGVELHLTREATLLGSTNPDDYQKLNRWKAILLADHQQNISISGYGKIDGQGRKLALNLDSLFYAGQIDSVRYDWVHRRTKEPMRPQLIEFVNCENITVRNITLLNAACWLQTYEQCSKVTLDSLQVKSDAYWNNDGIDIVDCRQVRITNCNINSADDGICLKSQSPKHYCDSIYIAHCTIRSSASAVKFGTVSHGGFKNVTIEKIKVYDTFRSALAIECVDGGFLENVYVNHLSAVNTGNAIFIRLGKRTKIREAGTLKNITIKNVKVEIAFERPDYAYDLRGPALPFFHNIFPSSITGIPGHAVENVTLENIEIRFPGRGNNGLAHVPLSRLNQVPEKEADYPEFSMFGELPAWGFYVRHMDGLTMKNIKLSIEDPDYRPALVFDDVRNLKINSLLVEGDLKPNRVILHRCEKTEIDEQKGVLKME
jgi:polygalacturonase